MPALQTSRLTLRPFTTADAPFVQVLVNDPDWLRNIGDRNVRTEDDARSYLVKGPLAMYAEQGLGLLRVALRNTDEPIGMCGLIRRPGLDSVDVGFALLPAFRGAGYAFEATRAVLDDGRGRLALRRIVAIVAPGNAPSITLLARLGFTFERSTEVGPGNPVLLYALS